MPNINKIKLSGTSYDIQDSNATKTVTLTQAQYDALQTKDPNTFYIISDGETFDPSGKVDTSAFTAYSASVETALSGKQNTLSAGTGIDITNNVISATGGGGGGISGVTAEYDDTGTDGEFLINVNSGQSFSQIFKVGSGLTVTEEDGDVILSATGGGGGGKAVSGGTNISVTTGETADTINCTLSGGTLINISNNKINCSAPIRYGTGVNSVIVGVSTSTNKATGGSSIANGGDANTASGQYSFAEGYSTQATKHSSHSEGWFTQASGNYSHAEGNHTKATNESEHTSGQYNVSNYATSTFGDSGNTLFSVGNGTSNNARHNAFEIRQNGDIYLTSGGTDIKLQDHLGGGGSSYSAGTGIDITNDVISVTGKVDTTTYNTYTAATDTALASKQTTLTAGTNISIVDNVISATGGGGKAVVAGTNISVTTGTTADTINCTLRAANTSGTGSLKLAFLNNTDATGVYSVATGYDSKAKGNYSFASGRGNITNNYGECAVGFNNKSVGNSTSISKNSGCTLFSVGNGQGTSTASLHNAFEVRQNGDIYITLNDQDVKLQDQLGGGSSYTAGDGIDITNDVISVTGKVDTSAITTSVTSSSTDAQVPSAKAVNDKLGGLSIVKLTQAQYDALSTKDSNTLYVITNS